ncbi:hypothetical protein FLJC2902T_17590 [Flavobacterium limnosediminis JC2902]|uniref:Uncharacterized protein n=1 Tax=Flavobacterium limnosediminis JC2902 TaxID=1341181 RepID=V6SVE2_9FLAO|nr:hypothetical protein [Flavobacterium limnosediminis]ESU28400.1 hypothetical protein FLJC2902T_17590 [Flavobacterium limnosediminis JC2902]
MSLETILAIFSTLFGGTGVFAFLGARKERIAQSKITEASAAEAVQKIYHQMIIDTNVKMNQMQEEINSLKVALKTQVDKCNNCSKK